MANELSGLKVAILATDFFEQSELLEPRKALEAAGAKTSVISPRSGQIQGVKHTEKGERVKVDATLDQAKPDDFDAVLLPGGALNADALRVDRKAQDFVKKMDAARKPIAVICHGPWLLVSAGLVRGHHMTSYHTIRDDLENAGASWEDKEVIREGNWVSSRRPKDIPAFNRELIALLGEQEKKRAAA
jgi:protease I